MILSLLPTVGSVFSMRAHSFLPSAGSSGRDSTVPLAVWSGQRARTPCSAVVRDLLSL